MDSTSGQPKLSKELPLSDYERDIILTNPEVLRNAKPYNPSSGSTRRGILYRSKDDEKELCNLIFVRKLFNHTFFLLSDSFTKDKYRRRRTRACTSKL